MPRVSVVIPAYNSGHCISEAIESVLGQSFKDFEIVVVDDGSTDDTSEIVERYPEIRYFYQSNQGPSAARNKGVVESRGDYIAFLDADDALLEDSLQLRVAFLERHGDVDLVFSDLIRFCEPKGRPEIHLKENGFIHKFTDAITSHKGSEYVFGKAYTEMALKHHPFIKTPTVMVRRKAVNGHHGFNTDLHIAEDVDLWLRIADAGKLGFIDAPLAVWNNYRSMMTSSNTKLLEETIKYYKSMASRFECNHDLTRLFLVRRKLSSLYFRLGYALHSHDGSKIESIAKYLHGLRYSPSNVRVLLYILIAAFPPSLLRYAKNCVAFFGKCQRICTEKLSGRLRP